MIYLVIAGIVFVVLTVLFCFSLDSFNTFIEIASMFGYTISAIAGIIIFITIAIFAYNWVGSEYKTNIINREYNTNYTKQEVFYASDVIDTIRELDRKRVELNGNLLKEKGDK